MSLPLKNLTELDPTIFEDVYTKITETILQDNPQIDFKAGPLFSLLAYYGAALGAQRQDVLNRYLKARSLRQILQNPEESDPDLVEDIISNFGLIRKVGKKAKGDIVIILSTNTSVIIPSGSVFVAQGKRFVTPDTFTAKLEANQIITTTDRLLTRRNDGTWSFTIPLVAETEGTESQIKKDTTVIPLISPSFYVTSYALSDFTGGVNQESNTELISRQQFGITSKSFGNRMNMTALLREHDDFKTILSSSLIGLGDPEMHRDKHTIIPIAANGGRVDWYIRTQEDLNQITYQKKAILVDIDSVDGFGIWSLTLPKTESAGFYKVKTITSVTEPSLSLPLVEEIFGFDLTNEEWTPDIKTNEEARYSAYQTAIIRFKDLRTRPLVSEVGVLQKDYFCTVLGISQIRDIQNYVNQRDIRHWGSDCLIKAPVPCFVRIDLRLEKRVDAISPDIDTLKTKITQLVNNIGFKGKLYASQIISLVHSYLQNDSFVSAVDIFGLICYPNGEEVLLRSSEVITIPEDPENMVSARTTQFFCSSADVTITVNNLISNTV